MLRKGDWVLIKDHNPEYDGKIAFVVDDEGGNVCVVELPEKAGWQRRCGKDRLEKIDPVLYPALKFAYLEGRRRNYVE